MTFVIKAAGTKNASYCYEDTMPKKNEPLFSILILFSAILVLASCARTNGAPARTKTPSGERYVYKVVGEQALDLFVYLPPEEKRSDHMPAILFFHGGGYTSGSAYQFEHQSQYFASLGMVCISVNYRLRNAENSVLPTDAIEDGQSALAWVIQHAAEFGIDTTKISLAGGSAGGHLALSIYLSPDLALEKDKPFLEHFKPVAFLLLNPATDIADRQADAERLGVALDLDTINPQKLVHTGMPPTLTQHGDKDTKVPIEEAYRFRDRNLELGNDYTLIVFPGEGHGFHNYGQKAYDEVIANMESFLREHNQLPESSK